MSALEIAALYEQETISMRRWLHQHPELAWEEYETTDYIEERLKAIGVEVHRYEDHTGLWAMIYGQKNATESKMILLRADIDALPGDEKTGVHYTSLNEGRVHSCGHDCHVAMLLTAAKILEEHKDELNGNVRLVFEAAEETANGARYYVEQGIMDGVDAVYSCHMWTEGLEAGCINAEPGPRMASCDEFRIKVNGTASHTGAPQLGNDAILAAANIITNLQVLETRMNDPLNPLTVEVGKIKGGEAFNIMSGYVEMCGSVRTFSPEARELIPQVLEKVVQNSANVTGCSAKTEYIWNTGPVIHDEILTQLVIAAAEKICGKEKIKTLPKTVGGDTFAYYSEKAPGVFAFIGGRNENLNCEYPPHHESFNIDESVLKLGTAMFVQVAYDFLN